MQFMPAISATWEVDEGGLWFEVSPGKVSMRPYLQNKLKKQKDWEPGSNGTALA
jgi:hypothetical protein